MITYLKKQLPRFGILVSAIILARAVILVWALWQLEDFYSQRAREADERGNVLWRNRESQLRVLRKKKPNVLQTGGVNFGQMDVQNPFNTVIK